MPNIYDDYSTAGPEYVFTNSGTLTMPIGSITSANGVYSTHSPSTGSVGNDWVIMSGPTNSDFSVKGVTRLEGELILNGANVGDILERIEKRLAILRPNQGLEDKWEELKRLGDQYRQLEQEILEKEKIYNILKS